LQENNEMRCCLFLSLLFYAFSPWAQNEQDSLVVNASSFSWSAYFDVFYAYDFNKPSTNFRQTFLFNHNRHNAFSINHALVEGSYENNRTRAKLGFHAGTYVQDNYRNENQLISLLYTANVGLALDKKKRFWLDAGVMESHIGFEGAKSYENVTLTRSLCAEQSPYFNAGAALTFQPKESWSFQILALNGWQRIERMPGNSLLSSGSKVNYKSKKFEFNWSTFLGTDDPDSTRRMRYFSNLYAVYKMNHKLSITVGFDYGIQQTEKGSSSHYRWLNLTTVAKIAISERLNTGIRLEYFNDFHKLLIQTPTYHFFEALGFSLNLDYSFNEHILFRMEGRAFDARLPFYIKDNEPLQSNIFLISSLVFKLKNSK